MSLFNVYPLNPIAITKAADSRVWDDKGQEYNIRFTLPWKSVGWYISNSESELICSICENMSKKQNQLIKKYN